MSLFFFRASNAAYTSMQVPRLGIELEVQLQPKPQAQQSGILATSANHTAACGNVGSLRHWARPEIEPHGYQSDS